MHIVVSVSSIIRLWETKVVEAFVFGKRKYEMSNFWLASYWQWGPAPGGACLKNVGRPKSSTNYVLANDENVSVRLLMRQTCFLLPR